MFIWGTGSFRKLMKMRNNYEIGKLILYWVLILLYLVLQSYYIEWFNGKYKCVRGEQVLIHQSKFVSAVFQASSYSICLEINCQHISTLLNIWAIVMFMLKSCWSCVLFVQIYKHETRVKLRWTKYTLWNFSSLVTLTLYSMVLGIGIE